MGELGIMLKSKQAPNYSLQYTNSEKWQCTTK
jgi:hypothetical protein